MNARQTAFAFALLAIALTLAQDVVPARDWYHGWEYLTILAIAIVVMIGYAWRNRRAETRVAGALVGALAVAVAGLLSGLIGPDTVTVIGTPGTVTPVPDLKVAAFFEQTDAQTIARGDATVTLRSRTAQAVSVGPRPLPLGLSVVFTQPKPAAYVVVRDERGQRLTITQPNNPVFLSPVMLFRTQQDIHGRAFPLDTFAVPALHRVVRILYFGPAELAAFRHDTASATSGPAAILSVSDDQGAAHGLMMAPSGQAVHVGDLDVLITLGTYPVLQVASAPQPFAVIAGLALFVVAGLWSTVSRRPAPEPAISATT